jgi:hypothetical protein
LHVLAKTTKKILDAQGDEAEDNEMLLSYGRRRRGKLFGTEGSPFGLQTASFLGLGNPLLLNTLTAETQTEFGVRYLRNVAEDNGLQSHEAVIVYTEVVRGATYLILTTAVAHHTCGPKNKEDERHARWLFLNTRNQYLFSSDFSSQSPVESMRRTELMETLAPLSQKEDLKVLDHSDCPGRQQIWFTRLSRRLCWRSCPSLYSRPEISKSCLNTRVCRCFDNDLESGLCLFDRAVGFGVEVSAFPVYGQCVNLYVIKGSKPSPAAFISCEKKTSPPGLNLKKITETALSPVTLARYLTIISANSGLTTSLFAPGILHDTTTIFRKIVLQQLMPIPAIYLRALEVLAVASEIYGRFQSATIPLRIVSRPVLLEANWLPNLWSKRQEIARGLSEGRPAEYLDSAQAFACITMFESGGINIDPKELTDVIAMSAGNSIFVAGSLLSGPTSDPIASRIKQVKGNIDSPGLSLIFSVQNPRIRPESVNYKAVAHADYDQKREDNFAATSLHLSFTGWNVPLAFNVQGYIDRDIHFIEAVVSVRDRGVWVADIDVLTNSPFSVMEAGACHCPVPQTALAGDLVSIDSWDELLDAPESAAVVRSHKNWSGRLAAACVAQQKFPGRRIWIIPEHIPCWNCFRMSEPIGSFAQPVSNSEPAILID